MFGLTSEDPQGPSSEGAAPCIFTCRALLAAKERNDSLWSMQHSHTGLVYCGQMDEVTRHPMICCKTDNYMKFRHGCVFNVLTTDCGCGVPLLPG